MGAFEPRSPNLSGFRSFRAFTVQGWAVPPYYNRGYYNPDEGLLV